MRTSAAIAALAATCLLQGALEVHGAEKGLKDLVGVWARSPVDCEAVRDDNDQQYPSEAAVGICADGVDLIGEPVGCLVTGVRRSGGELTLAGKCRIKDYPLETLRDARLVKLTPGAVTFERFGTGNFSIEGDYVRCSRAFTCAEFPR